MTRGIANLEVAAPLLKEIIDKQPGPAGHPVEQLLVALYGFLMLRLQSNLYLLKPNLGLSLLELGKFPC